MYLYKGRKNNSKTKFVGNYKRVFRDFPGGVVDKNPPTNSGDMGSIPGPGRSHMLRSN